MNKRIFSLVLVAAIVAAVIAGLCAVSSAYGLAAAVGLYIAIDAAARLPFLSRRLGASLNMLDIAKLTGNDATVGLIEENIKKTPEMELFPMRSPIAGTSYRTGIRTGLPTVSFRNPNEGVTPSKSSFRQALVQCFILDAQIKADKAVAEAHEGGAAAYQALEASAVAEAALRTIGRQIFYGVSADTKGFAGLKAFTPKAGTTADGEALVIDATGSTANTASSVYAVRFGPRDAILVPGRGQVLGLGDWRIQTVPQDDDATKQFTAYVNDLCGWLGLQLGNEHCVRRICNLTAQTGKGLTDSLLADLLNLFPSGMMPDAIFMSRRSRTQLQKSRGVVLQGQGKLRPDVEAVAPIPTSYDGVPIYATDSILNTDAIE